MTSTVVNPDPTTSGGSSVLSDGTLGGTTALASVSTTAAGSSGTAGTTPSPKLFSRGHTLRDRSVSRATLAGLGLALASAAVACGGSR